jgi:hypothetical protein
MDLMKQFKRADTDADDDLMGNATGMDEGKQVEQKELASNIANNNRQRTKGVLRIVK